MAEPKTRTRKTVAPHLQEAKAMGSIAKRWTRWMRTRGALPELDSGSLWGEGRIVSRHGRGEDDPVYGQVYGHVRWSDLLHV